MNIEVETEEESDKESNSGSRKLEEGSGSAQRARGNSSRGKTFKPRFIHFRAATRKPSRLMPGHDDFALFPEQDEERLFQVAPGVKVLAPLSLATRRCSSYYHRRLAWHEGSTASNYMQAMAEKVFGPALMSSE